MKNCKVPVKSKEATVGEAEYFEFDSVSEAQQTLGDVVTLDLINSQHRTNAMNAVRSAATQKPSKAQFLIDAQAEFMDLPNLNEYRGDKPKMQAKIAEIAADLEAKWTAENNRKLAEIKEKEATAAAAE